MKNAYTLSTPCFSEEEHNILLEALKHNFDISCNVTGKKYKSIYIPVKGDSNKKFKTLVEPFIVPSMRYKL